MLANYWMGYSLNPDFEQIIISWKDERGKIPWQDEPRIQAYLDLINTLVTFGYSKEDITARTNVNQIIHESHNSNSKKASKWAANCLRTWKVAVTRYWPLEIVKYDHEAASAKRDKNLETQALRDARTIESLPTKEEYEGSNDSEESLEDAPMKRYGKEWVDDPKMIKPEVIYDAEMSKFLGFDDE